MLYPAPDSYGRIQLIDQELQRAEQVHRMQQLAQEDLYLSGLSKRHGYEALIDAISPNAEANINTSFAPTQESSMKFHQIALAFALFCPLGISAAEHPSPVEVRGEFFYGTNPDDGLILKICPDKASRSKDSFLAKHECFIARNIETASNGKGARVN